MANSTLSRNYNQILMTSKSLAGLRGRNRTRTWLLQSCVSDMGIHLARHRGSECSLGMWVVCTKHREEWAIETS